MLRPNEAFDRTRRSTLFCLGQRRWGAPVTLALGLIEHELSRHLGQRMQIQKLDIAIEQLTDGLEKYFAGRFFSAIVLAGAAEQLLAGYVLKHGLPSTWLQERAAATKIANGVKERDGAAEPTTERQLGDLMNWPYNQSKHAGTKDHVISMDAKSEARELIDRAISNYDVLFNLNEYNLHDLPLAQRFKEEYASQASLL